MYKYVHVRKPHWPTSRLIAALKVIDRKEKHQEKHDLLQICEVSLSFLSFYWLLVTGISIYLSRTNYCQLRSFLYTEQIHMLQCELTFSLYDCWLVVWNLFLPYIGNNNPN